MGNMNKIIAGVSALAIVAMSVVSFTANAANISVMTVNGGSTLAANTEITAVSFTPVTALTNGSTITVSYPATVVDAGLVTGDIAVANGDASLTAGAVTVDTANNLLTIPVTTAGTANSPVTLTFSNTHFTGPANGNITFGVTTTVGDRGALVVYVAASNVVNVSATVVPTMSLALANGTDGNQAIAFGNLTPGSFAKDDIGLTYASNAVGGVVIAMAAGGLRDGVVNREIGVSDIAGATPNTAAADYYKASTAGGTAAVTFDTVDNALNNAGGADMDATQNVVTTSAPNASATQMVTVGTQVAASTEAGNYTDTLTFTITGTF